MKTQMKMWWNLSVLKQLGAVWKDWRKLFDAVSAICWVNLSQVLKLMSNNISEIMRVNLLSVQHRCSQMKLCELDIALCMSTAAFVRLGECTSATYSRRRQSQFITTVTNTAQLKIMKANKAIRQLADRQMSPFAFQVNCIKVLTLQTKHQLGANYFFSTNSSLAKKKNVNLAARNNIQVLWCWSCQRNSKK